MLKTRIIVAFISLFAFIFTYLHAIPPPPPPPPVDHAIALLKKIKGIVIFDQIVVKKQEKMIINGIIGQGIDENTPENYFISFSYFAAKNETHSFAELNIPIKPPRAGPWNVTIPGVVDQCTKKFYIGITKMPHIKIF
ncbi:hypothetical protein F8M41_004792 [Gigaspora margarita]|uniref:Uncharacterized protein n=1 Tax=Gigaspora margarita TaxID=4874 RepID=A0A8H3X9Y6_GIGMA|nr:hypothetical protein F8M41_004792 [Gigaspora margarita]